MNSKKVIIIISIIAIVMVLVLSILLITLKSKKDNSAQNVAVENSVSTNNKEKDNTSKTKDDDDEEDDEDENESNTNTRNSRKSKNDDMLEQLSATEKMAFNSMFERYKGKQRGSNVSSLLMTLKSNSQTQEDNEDHLPYIIYINADGEYFEETTDVSIIEEDIGEIENVHTYYVDVAENEETGFIHGIVISYHSNDDIKEDIENLAKKIANK